MRDEIKKLIESYTKWLSEKTYGVLVDEEWARITTPFIDRNNDCIQLYIKKVGSELVISDDGYTIDDLELSGCSLDSEKRQDLLNVTLSGFGVVRNGNELVVKATSDNFPLKKHSLIQAMLAVNDLFYLASPYVKQLFYEDVVAWLDEKDVRYVPSVKFSGQSGFDHNFDFVVPKSRNYPERILQTITSPKKDSAENLIYKWLDTKASRKEDAILYAVLNDTENTVSSSVTTILKNYNVVPLVWTKRENRVQELVG
ncbi:MAG: DUF1829 domain-containing protein [Deferribacterales bacterium]